jgi:enhancer of polycomb-like protein
MAICPATHQNHDQTRLEGCKIIPQLDLDESNDTDPFVCFRRLDAKAVHKTRCMDNTLADEITRWQIELHHVSDFVLSVVVREMKKAELSRDSQLVLESRLCLFNHKR